MFFPKTKNNKGGMDYYVVVILAVLFVDVCIYIAAVVFAKKKQLQHVQNSQIIYSGLAGLDIFSDVNYYIHVHVYVFINIISVYLYC